MLAEVPRKKNYASYPGIESIPSCPLSTALSNTSRFYVRVTVELNIKHEKMEWRYVLHENKTSGTSETLLGI